MRIYNPSPSGGWEELSTTTCMDNVLQKGWFVSTGVVTEVSAKAEQEVAVAWKSEEKRGTVRAAASKSGCVTKGWAGFNYQHDVRLCTLPVLGSTLDLNWFLCIHDTTVQYKMPKYWECPPRSSQFGPCSWLSFPLLILPWSLTEEAVCNAIWLIKRKH